MFIPSLVLKQLYTFGSLDNTPAGVKCTIKNRLSESVFTGLQAFKIDGKEIPLAKITLEMENGDQYKVTEISKNNSLDFPLRKVMSFVVDMEPISLGKHALQINFSTTTFGKLKLKVDDSIVEHKENRVSIPRDVEDNYSDEAIKARHEFIEHYTKIKPNHIKTYSFDAHMTEGNCEAFSGVAQIPLGFAGPLTVNGEYAKGDFLIPMATTEGTLVASYNRGIKVVNLSGGVTCTVSRDYMQRAPVFVFNNARESRDFVDWINEPDNLAKITYESEATTSIGKLVYIDPYLSNNFAFLRFNFSTGDAAGQNMVGRATFAASSWILDSYPKPIKRFYLESNFATDKKASQVNIMRTRGKRVTAECVIKRDVLVQHMRVEPESLYTHSKIATIGSFMSGANNNGAHSPNAITAMFIATGQDVANVAESSAGIAVSDITPEGDLYLSLTIPSLIVATYGGGTGLATQRECLEYMDCYGKNRAKKFAEIVAGVALAGEISLGAAISSLDWVSSHESYGRNR